MKDHFRGKRAIVTGGASGIGRALCEKLSAAGATVIVADRNADGAQKLADDLGRRGPRAHAWTVDVTDKDAVNALVDGVAEKVGAIDFMFNNAGIAIVGEARHMDVDDFDRMIDVNLRGVVYGALAAYRVMRDQGFGHIINTASVAGLIPTPGFVGYGMTKHGVVGLSVSLRCEAQEHGVNVSAVCPGVIDTPMARGGAETRGRDIDTDAVYESFRLKPYPAERCAADILVGVEQNEPLIVVTRGAKTMHALYRAAPAAINLVISNGLSRLRARLGR